jgi:hypothetical protein
MSIMSTNTQQPSGITSVAPPPAVTHHVWATHYVCIDSSDRDRKLYPKPCSYVVHLPTTIGPVVEVELVYAQYTKTTPDGYVVLVLDECAPNNIVVTGDRSLCNAFTVLPLTAAFNEYNVSMFRSIKRFDPYRAKLNRLTIQFHSADGTLAESFRDHMMRFEIRTAVVRQKNEAHDSVYYAQDAGRDAVYLRRTARLLASILSLVDERVDRIKSSNNANSSSNKNNKDNKGIKKALELARDDSGGRATDTLDEPFEAVDTLALDPARRRRVVATVAGSIAVVAGGAYLARKHALHRKLLGWAFSE